MQKIFFKKMSGAGNDFVFIDINQNEGINLRSESIKKICNRRNGVGADGLITIKDTLEYNFNMHYYNADGLIGSLCGNGARCAIWFAEKTGRLKDGNARFTFNGKEFSGKVLGDELIQFNLASPKQIKYNFKVMAANQLITANYADTGSPHVVIKIQDIAKDPKNPRMTFTKIMDVPVYKIGREIRYSKDFYEGTNVNFVDVKDGVIHIRTYERGVEDETLACGTGSVAAALVCYVTDKLRPPINLMTFGGDKLTVNFEVENHKVKNVTLTGPAKIIFEGSIDQELFI